MTSVNENRPMAGDHRAVDSQHPDRSGAGAAATGEDTPASHPDGQPVADLTDAASYLAHLWGERRGWALLAFGYDGTYTAAGKYEFPAGSWREQGYRWPSHRAALLADIADAAARADVYVCPMLRTTARRRKTNALGGAHAWADVDGWDEQRARQLDALLTPGSLLVSSGSADHRHVYLHLGQWCEPATVETYNRRLGVLLQADHKWAHNSLLRLPGTYNHKARAAGNTSTPVEVIR